MAAVRTIARETRQDEGKAATLKGYCGDDGGEVDSDGGGKSKGGAATTAGYHRNGNGGDKDDSKENSSENGECSGNNRGGISHLSLRYFLFFCRAQDTNNDIVDVRRDANDSQITTTHEGINLYDKPADWMEMNAIGLERIKTELHTYIHTPLGRARTNSTPAIVA